MNTAGRRGKTIWLALLGVLVALVSLASVSGGAAISPAVAFGMVVAYIAVLFVTLSSLDLSKIGQQLTRTASTRAASVRTTPAARRASGRARASASYGYSMDEVLMDIGLLVNDRRRDGRWDRRLASSASLEDGYIQPYIKLHAPPEAAERMTLVEFEFYDRAGNLQFTHKMEEYLRQGDNLILCDRQLALRGNAEIGRAGTWDLRVKLNGNLIGMYDFSMSSVSSERAARLADDDQLRTDRAERESAGSRSRRLADDAEDDEPVSLEDLLREQARRSSSRE